MGCSTCNQKNTVNSGNSTTLNFLPNNLQDGDLGNGSFIFKVIAFFVVIIALPFILVVLLVQMFLHFFLPKSLPKVSRKFKNFFISIFEKYGEFKYNKEVKKREKQFKNNLGYEEGSELVDVVDYEMEDTINNLVVHEKNNDVKK